MNDKQKEACLFYKSIYSGVVLFRVANNYEAYGEDVKILSELYAGTIENDRIVYDETVFNKLFSALSEAGVTVNIVQYRAANGNFELPKVKQILQEMEDDY